MPLFDDAHLKTELEKRKLKDNTAKLCDALRMDKKELVGEFTTCISKLNASPVEKVDPFFAKAGHSSSHMPFMIDFLTAYEPFKTTSSFFLRNLLSSRLLFVTSLAPRSVLYWQWETEPEAVYLLLEGHVHFYFMNEEQREDEAAGDENEDECDSWERCNSTRLEKLEDGKRDYEDNDRCRYSSRMALGDRVNEDVETGHTFGNKEFRNISAVPFSLFLLHFPTPPSKDLLICPVRLILRSHRQHRKYWSCRVQH